MFYIMITFGDCVARAKGGTAMKSDVHDERQLTTAWMRAFVSCIYICGTEARLMPLHNTIMRL
jgi:hypothetical protein